MFYHSLILVMDVVVVFFFGWSSSVIWWKWNKTSKYFYHIMYIHITSSSPILFFCYLMRFANHFVVIAAAASQLHFAELRKIVIVFHFIMNNLWLIANVSHFWSQNSMNGFRNILFLCIFEQKSCKSKGHLLFWF